MHHTISPAFTVLLLVPITSLLAQRLPQVSIGERVRVAFDCTTRPVAGGNRTDCERNVGTLVAFSDDSITLRVTETPSEFSLLLDSVKRLEVQRGKSSNARSGVFLGVLVGVVAAIPVALAEREGYTCTENSLAPCGGVWDPLVAIPIIFGGAGGILGGVVGNLVKTDRWEEVPLDRVRVSFAPQTDRVSFGFRIAF